MSMKSWMVAAVSSCAILGSQAALASSFQQFDLPGASSTCGSTISGKGVVTGYAAGTPFVFDTETGRFTTPKPDVPAGTVLFLGVTLNHTILVTDLFQQNDSAGDYLFHHGVTTALSGLAADASGINDRGTIFGITGNLVDGIFGFVLAPDGTEIKLINGDDLFAPRGIDDRGRSVVGYSGIGGFFYRDGKYTAINVPAALFTVPNGVDNLGRISGTYYLQGNSALVANGFLLRGGVYQTWNVPGAIGTAIEGENERGQIVGCFLDSNGMQHGFFATP
jgi:hypothetical protein